MYHPPPASKKAQSLHVGIHSSSDILIFSVPEQCIFSAFSFGQQSSQPSVLLSLWGKCQAQIQMLAFFLHPDRGSTPCLSPDALPFLRPQAQAQAAAAEGRSITPRLHRWPTVCIAHDAACPADNAPAVRLVTLTLSSIARRRKGTRANF